VVVAVKNLTLPAKKNRVISGDCQPQDVVVTVNRFFVIYGFISSLNY
jgi:hypothetical protein